MDRKDRLADTIPEVCVLIPLNKKDDFCLATFLKKNKLKLKHIYMKFCTIPLSFYPFQ